MFRIQHGNQSIIQQYLLQVKVLRQVKILKQIASYTLHNDYYGQVTNLNAPAYTVVFCQCVHKPSLFNILTCATLYSKEHAAILSMHNYSISLLLLLFYKPLTHHGLSSYKYFSFLNLASLGTGKFIDLAVIPKSRLPSSHHRVYIFEFHVMPLEGSTQN